MAGSMAETMAVDCEGDVDVDGKVERNTDGEADGEGITTSMARRMVWSMARPISGLTGLHRAFSFLGFNDRSPGRLLIVGRISWSREMFEHARKKQKKPKRNQKKTKKTQKNTIL